jgi:hypothetical protein
MEIRKYMKLYTEEEIIRAIELSDGRSIDEVLAGLTPIQLPSDEEIYEQAKSQSTFAPSFIYGAEWMRDKIIGGKK